MNWEDYKARFIEKKVSENPPPQPTDVTALKTELQDRFKGYDEQMKSLADLLKGYDQRMAGMAETLAKLGEGRQQSPEQEGMEDEDELEMKMLRGPSGQSSRKAPDTVTIQLLGNS